MLGMLFDIDIWKESIMTYKVGDKVKIWNTTLGGKPVVEGDAVLKKRLSDTGGLDRWEVEFSSMPGERYERSMDVSKNIEAQSIMNTDNQ